MPHFPTLPAFAVLAALVSSAAAEAPFTFSRRPYLQFATKDSINIVWRTRSPMLPEVWFGTERGKVEGKVKAENITVRRRAQDAGGTPNPLPLHSAPPFTWQFEAKVTGLKPDTKYYYTIADFGHALTDADETYTFRTLPEPGTPRPYAFWVVGDSGTAGAAAKATYRAFEDWRNKPGSAPIDFYVHVGDMAYNRGLDSEFQYSFFEIYEPLLRNTVCWPSMGNHEGGTAKGSTATGPYFDAYVSPARGEAGGLPSGTEAYYSWDYGTTHFICLDSHDLSRSADAPMAQWLKADLEHTKADWIIAYWHHPPYTKGSHDSDKEKDLIEMRQNILPIAESGGVDLILTGHSHIYERSMLIDGAYETPTVAEGKVLNDGDGDVAGDGAYHKRPGTLPNDGTVQIVAGHGGQAMSRKEKPSPIMKRTVIEWGSVIVEVNGNTLDALMLNADGQERDRFRIVKNAVEAPKRIAAPLPPIPAEGPLRLREYVPAKR